MQALNDSYLGTTPIEVWERIMLYLPAKFALQTMEALWLVAYSDSRFRLMIPAIAQRGRWSRSVMGYQYARPSTHTRHYTVGSPIGTQIYDPTCIDFAQLAEKFPNLDSLALHPFHSGSLVGQQPTSPVTVRISFLELCASLVGTEQTLFELLNALPSLVTFSMVRCERSHIESLAWRLPQSISRLKLDLRNPHNAPDFQVLPVPPASLRSPQSLHLNVIAPSTIPGGLFFTVLRELSDYTDGDLLKSVILSFPDTPVKYQVPDLSYKHSSAHSQLEGVYLDDIRLQFKRIPWAIMLGRRSTGSCALSPTVYNMLASGQGNAPAWFPSPNCDWLIWVRDEHGDGRTRFIE